IRDPLVTGVQTCALPICSYFGGVSDRLGHDALQGSDVVGRVGFLGHGSLLVRQHVKRVFALQDVLAGRLTGYRAGPSPTPAPLRSEERRVGTEWRTGCRT